MSVQSEYDLKIRLEKRFKPEIRRMFNTILHDFKNTLAINGLMLEANRYVSQWSSLLNNQYTRAQKSFVKVGKQEEAHEDEVLALALLAWREQNRDKQAQIISDTNRRQMIEAIDTARLEFSLQEVNPTNRQLALAATAILKRKFAGRVSGIAMFETQAPAESTKYIHAQVKNGLRPTIIGGVISTVVTALKRWWTQADGFVRTEPFNHVAAHGQTVNILLPFEVSGQFLNHPGDTSLGASMGNVANCRCGTEYL